MNTKTRRRIARLAVGVCACLLLGLTTGIQAETNSPPSAVAGKKAAAVTQSPPAKSLALDLGGGVKMEFVWIEALKGWVGKYEVTNAEYRRFKADHNSGEYKAKDKVFSLNDDRQPVVQVSYNDAVAFSDWVNKTAKLPEGYKTRLPDGKEWLTFAQCGDKREHPWGNDWPPKYGNYGDATAKDIVDNATDEYNDGSAVSCEVEKSGKNDWGVYGVGGNVWEWTSEMLEVVQSRANRGACWANGTRDALRCAYNPSYVPKRRTRSLGFRLVVLR